MEDTFNRQLGTSLTTLSDYDGEISRYREERFWQTLGVDLCDQEEAIGLLKDFALNPYNRALRNLEKENAAHRQAHIKKLRQKRQERENTVRAQTESKAREVISSLNPQVEGEGDFVFFDFAHHKDYYEQVCGASSLVHLTTDVIEQEIVRQHYAAFISRHSHNQMMQWHQKFIGFDELKTQLAAQKTLNSEMVELKKQLASKKFLKSEVVTLKKQLSVALEKQNNDFTRQLALMKFLKSEVVTLKKQLSVALEKQNNDFTRQLALMKEELESLKAPKLAIPEVARGYEKIYEKFLKGVLVYRPTEGSDVGRIDLPIAALSNPLDGTFDLSNCGNTGKYLSISTGYRKGYNPDNARKVEIWFAPWFLVDKEKSQLPTDHHMREILKTWNPEQAPIGMFWTWGGWDDGSGLAYSDYLTHVGCEEFHSKNLREWRWAAVGVNNRWVDAGAPWGGRGVALDGCRTRPPSISHFIYELN